MKSNLTYGMVLLLCISSCTLAEAQESKKSIWNFWGDDSEVKQSSFFGSKKKSPFSLDLPQWRFPGMSKADETPASSSYSSGGVVTASATAPAAEPKSSFSLPNPFRMSGQNPLTKMGRASKKFWSSTVRFVNPFDKKPEPIVQRQQGYVPQRQLDAEAKKGGFFSWMTPEPEPQYEDVNGFLGLSRPRLPH
ncbi:MAG: hypothetical protein AAGG44_05190 [Planctomycetota bacterium]